MIQRVILVCLFVIIAAINFAVAQDITPISPAIELPETVSPAPPDSPLIYKRFEGRFDSVIDRTRLTQDEPYNTLMKYVSELSPDEISKRVNPKVTHQELLKNPAAHRAEFIRASGLLLYLNPYKLNTNPGGVEIYYEGVVADPRYDRFYRFHLIDQPDKFTSFEDSRRNADDVEIEGAFLKIARYELERGRQPGLYNDAPFIIGRRITKVHLPPSSAAKEFGLIIAIGLIAALGVLGLVIFFSIRSQRRRPDRLADIRRDAAETKEPDSK
ncbi:MAG: hypothetical protein HY762_06795 [Planctomycetes bacterium]|nr:hypothetical protein [Planctomycetota bacterium]